MEWLNKKYRLIILAFLIAILLWFYVNNQNNNFPVLINDMKESFLIDIEIKNLGTDYEITKMSNRKVVIKLKDMPLFHSYKKENFTAYVNLSEICEGENIRMVEIKTPPNVKVDKIEPEFVKITIDKK